MSSMKMKGPEERRYSLPHGQSPIPIAASEDLHAWSIYRFVLILPHLVTTAIIHSYFSDKI